MSAPEDPAGLEKKLRALTPKRPSEALREQVLRQAKAALGRPVTPLERFWASWSFRWGWALGLAAMLVIGALSERSFQSGHWGEGAAGAVAAGPAASGAQRRDAELRAVLRIETDLDPSDTAAFGWGDPNRCDRYQALVLAAGADAGPRPDRALPRDTSHPLDEADRRHS
jgi:hypothetical protein